MEEEISKNKENLKTVRPWYKKKRYLVPSVFLGVLLLSGIGNSQTQVKPTSTYATPTAVIQPTETVQQEKLKTTPTYSEPTLSNDNYYTNSAGNEVHSPAYADSVPSGASAKCGDGTYSFSQSRQGTCSRHGGVSRWY